MSRALLTDMERKALRGEIDDQNQRSTYIARVRKRLDERFSEDARILKEHQPELFDSLKEHIDTVDEGSP